MHHRYFPSCPVEGPIEPPVPYGHIVLHGAVPNKCAKCPKLFEGGCRRYLAEVGRYLHLDYGFCGIPGPTDPVEYQDYFVVSKVEVPRKCVNCLFLEIKTNHGFYCRKDHDKWGDFYRSLDWGAWEPNSIYLNLPLPKVTTKALSKYAKQNNLVEFVKEHRRINPGLSLVEAKSDFQHFRSILSSFE